MYVKYTKSNIKTNVKTQERNNMKKNIRTLKYLLGSALWLIALYILFLVVTGMLNPYCVFTAKNIVFELTLIGGCSLVGSLFFCSTQKSSQQKYRIMQYYMTMIIT